MSEITPVDGADEEVVPDYSRVNFRALQALCKDRGIPGDGNSIALIEKLKAYDAQHGKDIDLSAAENLPPEEEVDLLELDDDGIPESPVGGGGAASASSPTGAPTAGEDVIGIGTTAPAGVITGLPEGASVTSAAPAVVVMSSTDLPRASGYGGRADLTVKNGLVKVGEGHGATEARAFRCEFECRNRIDDTEHFGFIADTHAAAQRAGHQTKGGATVGEHVGYSTGSGGRRTVIYQVPIKRQR